MANTRYAITRDMQLFMSDVGMSKRYGKGRDNNARPNDSLDHILQLRKDVGAVLCSVDDVAHCDLPAIH